jgi:hypothetical protein
MPSKSIYAAALAVVISCIASMPIHATVINYTSFLTPVAPSSAEGGAGITFIYDNVDNSLQWTVAFENVGVGTGGATAAHFHSDSHTGDIEIDLADGTNADGSAYDATIFQNAIGDETGAFIGTGTLSAAQVTDLLAGNMYVNIHSTNFSTGELHGQILEAQVVPVPAAVWLFGSGLLGLIGIARRRSA